MVIAMSVIACSFVYCLLVAIIYFSKTKLKNVENKIYSSILISVFFGLFFEFLCCYISWAHLELLNEVPNIIVNKLWLLYILIWEFLFTRYVFYISFKEKIDNNLIKTNLINKISYVLLFVFSFLIILLPIYFFNGVENGVTVGYSYGPAVYCLYSTALICLIVDLVSVIKNLKNIKSKKYVPLFVFIFCMILVVAIRFINPQLLLINGVFCFVTVLMYFTIENPDVKMIEQLEIARDAADKANAAKTDFLSSMSHEIRTPLNAIVGFSDCIKNSYDISEAKENANDIINASNTLLEIVNGILDISKIEAGKLEIINANYNASNLFNGLSKLMMPKMNEKGLDFQVTIAPDLPNVLYGDSANIKKVVTNLLSNAYKYTDTGFVKYDVKCVNANGVCRLIITVTDSGRGIKRESIDKLFSKFQRVDEDRNTTIEGTGLGLAITKQLIELMGGSVVVDSVYGEGSKFTITLDQRIENVEIVEEKTTTIDTIDLTGRRILVVDDNHINLKVAGKLLERYHASVEVCDSGFACIDLIKSGATFDLILMDDMMPKMSGTQTLQKLKEIDTFSIPVFALTANAITGMKERYLAAGFDSYLAKPIEKEALIIEFNKLFKDKPIASYEKQEDIVVKQDISEENDFVKNVEYLKSNSIDVDHGLELLGDIDLYNDTMNDFVDEIEKRLPLLQEYKNNSDMPNYAIIVHAIKSDCKYLGIMNLADFSYEHELKSKANDIEFVNANYDELINLIENYVSICKNYLNRD